MSLDLLTMLEQLRAHEINHRDFKSGNIVVSQALRLVLIDFGQAVEHKHRNDLTGRFVTTPHVRSAEVICGTRAHSFQVDTHSCACVIWEVLMGGQLTFPLLHSNNLKNQKDLKTYSMTQLHYLLGTEIRKFEEPRDISTLHSPTFDAVCKLPTRQRYLKKTFYRRFCRRLDHGKVIPIPGDDLAQAFSMINSLL